MNKNVLIVLGGALAVAVVVAMLVQVSLGGKKKQAAVSEAKVEILVAAKDLASGSQLRDTDMRWQEWPRSSVFTGAIIRENDKEAGKALSGKLGRNVARGEPLMRSALLGESKGNIVAGSLDPGMRAVAIEVKAVSMVGGFINPGDFVDIMLIYKTSVDLDDDDPRVKNMLGQNFRRLATETILQNVKILAVDQAARRTDEKVRVGKTVTLALSSADAERVALAGTMGELVLALRGVGDDKVVVKDWQTVSDARLVTIDDEMFTEYNRMKKDAGISPESMRIYNGANMALVPSR